MSLELCILASGSAGNCTVVRSPAGVMLIDAGIGPRTSAKRMNGTGVCVRDVRAICLTHLDRDHFTPAWTRTIVMYGIRVFCHANRLEELVSRSEGQLEGHAVAFEGSFEPLPGLKLRPVALAHDEEGSHGFVMEGFGRRVGYATDLGRVPKVLLERFTDLDVLAIESNYDPQLQRESGRPWFLQQRITGGRGHLSNEQALGAVKAILDRCQIEGARLPEHIVLLHRSRDCNCPKLVRNLFSKDARIARRLTLAEQYERTDWIRPVSSKPLVGEQLSLAWG